MERMTKKKPQTGMEKIKINPQSEEGFIHPHQRFCNI